MHSDAVSNAIFALRMKRMHQTSFPIENDTQQGVCDPSSSQNAYYANACILALTMHSIVINNAIFSLIGDKDAPDICSHRKRHPTRCM